MAATVYVGQRIVIEMEIRLNGVPTDPTIVQCTTRSPLGVVSTLTYPDELLTRRSEGLYEANILVDEAGPWVVRGISTGIVDGVNEFVQDVQQSGLTG